MTWSTPTGLKNSNASVPPTEVINPTVFHYNITEKLSFGGMGVVDKEAYLC